MHGTFAKWLRVYESDSLVTHNIMEPLQQIQDPVILIHYQALMWSSFAMQCTYTIACHLDGDGYNDGNSFLCILVFSSELVIAHSKLITAPSTANGEAKTCTFMAGHIAASHISLLVLRSIQ